MKLVAVFVLVVVVVCTVAIFDRAYVNRDEIEFATNAPWYMYPLVLVCVVWGVSISFAWVTTVVVEVVTTGHEV